MERIESHLTGIGELLKARQFVVPPYQRAYSWTDEQVTELIKDISDAIAKNSPEYFLGTVVVTKPHNGCSTIIDGQQRLVTTSLLVGAIRDYFDKLGTKEGQERANIIKSDYLSRTDVETLTDTARITLIHQDNDFYKKRVISRLGHDDRSAIPTTASQKRIATAIERVGAHVDSLAASSHEPATRLLSWRKFMEEKAKVIVVDVSDEGSAYVIFEVLNDRGLELSIVDLLKNYIFSQAGTRVAEAQEAWARMTGTITEGVSEAGLKSFIRHVWASRLGFPSGRNARAGPIQSHHGSSDGGAIRD